MFKTEAVKVEKSTLASEKYIAARRAVSTSRLLAISEFLSRAWFTRRWVLQEVALGHAVIMLCGDQKLAWDWFYPGTKLLDIAYRDSRHYQIRDMLSRAAVQALRNMITLGAARIERGGNGRHEEHDAYREYEIMLQLLWNCHTATCADERDRLYSFYGMLPAIRHPGNHLMSLESRCPVDYRAHFVSAYTKFTRAAVEADLGHEIWHHAIAFGNLSQQNETWPSWVPSWNMSRKVHNSGVETKEFVPLLSDDRRGWRVGEVQEREALELKGYGHRISATQRSRKYVGVISYVKTMSTASSCVRVNTSGRYSAAFVLAYVISYAKRLYDRNELDFNRTLYPQTRKAAYPPSYTEKILEARTYLPLFNAIWRMPGCPDITMAEDRNMSTNSSLLNEVNKVLQRHEAFCYKPHREPLLGVAFTRVEVGDFVFRPIAAGHVDSAATQFALVIRPYSPLKCKARGRFRLVGACMDSYP